MQNLNCVAFFWEGQLSEQAPSIFSQKLKVLVVEDNAVDKKLLQSMIPEFLPNPGDVQFADSLNSACHILNKMKIDVIILDLNLPDSQGLVTLTNIHQKYPEAAIVVNTGAFEEEIGLKTMSMGAQDFIVKGKYKAYALNKAIYYARERKRFEMELLAAYKRLQETQSQLIEAEKMNVVGSLASGIAHEVKNPLATILFGVAYLSETVQSADEKIKLTLTSIKESANRANDIITDLLDFASLARLNKTQQDINALLEKSLSLTKHQLDKQAIRVVREFDARLSPIFIDSNRIEQVLVNLILNAVHAMPSGGVLKLKTYQKILDGEVKNTRNLKYKDLAVGAPVVFIEIEDNGTGIPDDKLDKVFDPFFTTRRAKGGVGLGLSVARNIVEMHEGGIWVENLKKTGTRAGVILPVSEKGKSGG